MSFHRAALQYKIFLLMAVSPKFRQVLHRSNAMQRRLRYRINLILRRLHEAFDIGILVVKEVASAVSGVAPQVRDVGLIPARLRHPGRQAAKDSEAALQNFRRRQQSSGQAMVSFEYRDRIFVVDTDQQDRAVVLVRSQVITERLNLRYEIARLAAKWLGSDPLHD